METVDSILKSLNEIQDNLVGILIPSVITAIISVLTLIVDVIVKFWTTRRQYKSKQYEIMREHYPQLKSKLSDIVCYYDTLEENKLRTATFTITHYLKFDWEAYRQNIAAEDVPFVDEFQNTIAKIIEAYIDLYKFFSEKNLPNSSKKVQKSINKLQFFCTVINNSKNNGCKAATCDYNKENLIELIDILDKHYNKF